MVGVEGIRRSLARSSRGFIRRGVNRAVLVIRPHLAPGLYAALAEAVSVAGGGPVSTIPEYARILVVAPHPDDETIGCGATLALMTSRGTVADVLIATDGGATLGSGLSPSDLGNLRRNEATRACEILGSRSPRFLGHDDGRLLTNVSELSEQISAAALATRAQAVFVPWPLDAHPDHQAVALATAKAGLPASTHIWTYEVWSALPPNRVVDVTTTWPVKLAALKAHTMASCGFDASAFLSLQRWRSIFGGDGVGYREAFLVLSPSELRKLTASVHIGSGESS